MAKKTMNAQIRAGGNPIPNPAFVGLDKKMKPLMEKLEELDRATREAAKAYKEAERLELEAEQAPHKFAATRAEALLRGDTATALQAPGADARGRAAEARQRHELWNGPVRSKIRAEIVQLVEEHPEWQELAENKALEGAQREQEIQQELREIQRNREFSYTLLRWLRNPERGVVGLRGATREV
jgi:hypothetical protein